MEKFKASWGKQVKKITIGVIILLTIPTVHIWVKAAQAVNTVSLILLLVSLMIFVGIIAAGLARSPRYLTIDGESLIVKKNFGKITIKLSDITRIERRSSFDDAGKGFNTGGVFGILGKFDNCREGKYTALITNTSEMFWVMTESKKYTFSCDESDKLIAEVKRRTAKIQKE